MIQTKHFISAIILCSTLSISAIDINNTVEIIEEASKATENLREDFSQLIETKEPIHQDIVSTIADHNITVQKVIIVEESIENIATKENNVTIKKLPIAENKLGKLTNIATEEHNKTIKELTKQENKVEEPTTIVTIETNKTIPKKLDVNPQTLIVNDTSIVEDNTSITESNITILLETNSTLEENQTIEQDMTTDEEDDSFTKGMIIFKTKLKAVCKMTGEEFAKNYTQEDWDDIYDNDEFEKIVYELCPDMKDKYDKKWTKDLYQFSLKYASDSDEIPEC